MSSLYCVEAGRYTCNVDTMVGGVYAQITESSTQEARNCTNQMSKSHPASLQGTRHRYPGLTRVSNHEGSLEIRNVVRRLKFTVLALGQRHQQLLWEHTTSQPLRHRAAVSKDKPSHQWMGLAIRGGSTQATHRARCSVAFTI